MIAELLSVPFVVLAWCWGGQTMKWIRPTGVSLSLFIVYLIANIKTWYLGLPNLLYGGELTMGYGENSVFHKLAQGIDLLTRFFYSLWCLLPILIVAILRGHPIRFAVSTFLMILAFQVHAGSWFSWTMFGRQWDLLGEDVYRSLSLSISMAWVLE